VEVAERVKAGEWTKSIGPDWFGSDVHHKTWVSSAWAVSGWRWRSAPTSVSACRSCITRRQHPQAEERFNARYCDLDTLLQEADFVCLILPLSEETHHLFGRRSLPK
jgi:gluconate 2-dehydrogenase